MNANPSLGKELEEAIKTLNKIKDKQKVMNTFRLAYLGEAPVNWCPALGTVLANEEVTTEGRSERGNHPLYRRPLKQWMMRITAFADRLLDDLEGLEWTDAIKTMQRNWIGKSSGAEIVFSAGEQEISVFTTRPDTLFGFSFLAISVDHEISNLYRNDPDFIKFKKECSKTGTTEESIAQAEKIGFKTSLLAINPLNQKKVPVYFANFVLMDYGLGAIFGCPAHDQRDLDFAKKYKLDVMPVVLPKDQDEKNYIIHDEAFTGDGIIINSDFLNGLKAPKESIKKSISLSSFVNNFQLIQAAPDLFSNKSLNGISHLFILLIKESEIPFLIFALSLFSRLGI